MGGTIEQARAAVGAGDFGRAAALARALLAQSQDDVHALEVLFLCQQEAGDRPGAEATLRRTIALAPDKQWPRGDLARLLIAGDRQADAERVLCDAVDADPGHADAHAMLGALLSEREMLVPGARHLQRAIALAGPHPQLVANLGRNLMRQGKLDDAEPLLREASRAAPGALLPIVHLAELAEQRDMFDEAARLLDLAEVIARRDGQDVTAQRAHLLSRTEGWRAGLDLLDAVPALAGGPLLLRARLRDRAERYRAAWDDAINAKRQLGGGRRHAYDAAAVETLFATWRGIADQVHRQAPAPARNDVPQPIFILGFPRSGTTLTEQVLASHSRIRAGGELPFVAELAAMGTGDPVRVRDAYLDRARAFGLLEPGADYFTDKMPLNEVYLPLLRLAFPHAPLVAVVRDPRDILVSAMQHDMTHGFHALYRLEDAAHHLAAISDLTDYYRSAGIAPHTLRYESFISDQAGETAALMAHVGLPVEASQLAFHESRRHAPTPSYAQVREPLHARAVGRWKPYAEMLAPVRDRLAPAIERGGY